MTEELNRDKELDLMLAPLRQQALSEADLNRMLTEVLVNSNIRRRRWAAMAFAAGMIVGIGGTLLLSRPFVTNDQRDMAEEFISDEFATVRQVSTK